MLTRSESETFLKGREFAARLVPPALVLFRGDLGVGKTSFIRGICEELGYPGRKVRSPSFTLINEYRGRVPILHVDLYRLEGESDFEGIGLEEILDSQAVVLVEWSEKLSTPPRPHWIVTLSHQGGDERLLTLEYED